jgi:hypothetical protein
MPQGGIGLQPKVAAWRLPWGYAPNPFTNLEKVAADPGLAKGDPFF